MNGLTTSIPKVFFQRFQAFPIGQQLADLIQDFQFVNKLVTNLVNKPLTFFIKFKLATSLVANLANGSLAK